MAPAPQDARRIGKVLGESAQEAGKASFTAPIQTVAWITLGLLATTFAVSFLLPTRARDEEEVLELVAMGDH
ncbi:hypothetical protein [Streptomyces sp. NPDC096323]|uniref:hypothetical protein n=1 Tax=Streptomyces sp. NPDC096323 TaxID=3155822 RepID=UPI003331F06C